MTKRTADSPPDPLRGLVSFKDPLGVRVVDPTGGETFERLVLCAELTPLEGALRDRVARLANFRHVRFPRVRAFEVHGAVGERVATITFDRTFGVRLSELLRPIDEGGLTVDVNAALQVAREALPALAVLHDSRAVAHGAIALERMVLTPTGRIVLVEHVLASAIERLQYPRTRLWKEFRIAVPPSAGLPRFDARSDVAQVALATFTLILGRPLALKEFPDGLKELLQKTNERLANGSVRPMTAALRAWFERALPIESRRPFTSALDAQVALEDVVKSAHAYTPTATSLKVIHDRFVAWEGAQRGAAEPDTGRVETPESSGGRPSSPSGGRRPPRRPGLRVVHHQEDEEAEEIRRLEVELERIRREEALADAEAVGGESVPLPPVSTEAPVEVSSAEIVVLPVAGLEPTLSEGCVDAAAAEGDDDVLTIDLDALVDEGGIGDQPQEPEATASEGLEAEPVWQLSAPTETPLPDEPAPSPATARDEFTSELPFDAEPEPDVPSLGRFLATASSATPPSLPPGAVRRLAAGLGEVRGKTTKRQGRRRRPGERQAPAAAELSADATPVASRIAVRASRLVDQAVASKPALQFASAAVSFEEAVRPGAPALAAQATPVAAALATRVADSTLERATVSAAPLALVTSATTPRESRPSAVQVLPADATPVAATLALPGETRALDLATRDFAPIQLVAAEAMALRFLARAEPRGDVAAEEPEAAAAVNVEERLGAEGSVAAEAFPVTPAPLSVAVVVPGPTRALQPDDVFIDAEAFELADGMAAVPPATPPAPAAVVVVPAAVLAPVESAGLETAETERAEGERAASDGVVIERAELDGVVIEVAAVAPPADVDHTEVERVDVEHAECDEAEPVPLEVAPAAFEDLAAEPVAAEADAAAVLAPVESAGIETAETERAEGERAASDGVVIERAELDSVVIEVAAVAPPADVDHAEVEHVDVEHDGSVEPASADFSEPPAAQATPELSPTCEAAAPPAHESKRRRRARRRAERVRPFPSVSTPTGADVSDAGGAVAPAPPSPQAAPFPPATGIATDAAADRPDSAERPSGDAAETAGVAAPPMVQQVAPWLRGKLIEVPATPLDDEDVAGPAIVNFDQERTEYPDESTPGSVAARSTAEPATTGEWSAPATRPAAASVVPFAAPAKPDDGPRVRARPEPPSGQPSAPVAVERPRIDWRRTAAASLLLVLIEGAAFGAAYWYVKPRELGYLNVRTSLPGIEVVVDGRPSGRTPASLELTPGRHSIELRGAGVTKVVPVEISAGVQTTQSIQWPKSARVGRLQVKSTPSGARVMIGHEMKGATPVTIESLPVGSHEVVVEGDAGSVRSTVKVRADQTAELNVGIYSGWLAVFAPVEVRIFESGKMLGTTLDGRLLMRPGTHTIELRNPSLGFNETRKVEITPGRVTALSLQPPTGVLRVEAPAGTEIMVDGEAKGTAPTEGIAVAVGTREVVLRHPQLGQRRFVVTVGAKVAAQVSFMAPP